MSLLSKSTFHTPSISQLLCKQISNFFEILSKESMLLVKMKNTMIKRDVMTCFFGHFIVYITQLFQRHEALHQARPKALALLVAIAIQDEYELT